MNELDDILAASCNRSYGPPVGRDDVVVLTFPAHLTKEQADQLTANVERELGDSVRVLVLTGGVQLSVLRRG